jgi:RHS repeat-associated protein
VQERQPDAPWSNGKSITWTSYDLPSLIQPTTDSNYNQFFYDAWRGRYKQVYKAGTPLETTIYVGGILEKWVRGSSTQWRHLIQVNGRTVALLNRSGTTNTVRYPLEDHLSGMAVLTTSAGGVYVKESFDAFGQRRNPATWAGAPSSGDLTLIRDASRRGFTFHEHLDNTALIHMNGRVQDPGIGRFLSADPYVPEPFDGQSFNRYSYVDNNPLSFSDPSGFDPVCVENKDCPKHHDYGNACVFRACRPAISLQAGPAFRRMPGHLG